MHSNNRQAGVTAIGWLIILGLIAFFTLLTLKIVPVYIDNFSIKTILKGLKNEPGITKKDKFEIKKMIQKRFDVNNIIHITKNDIEVERKGFVTTVRIKYTEQKNIAGNIDVLIRFDNAVKIVAN